MRILLLNWRDIEHPKKGGAEVLTHGIFKRLVSSGHEVTWFASAFNGGIERKSIDGIRVVRGGNAVTVRAHAYAHYRSEPRFDIVVDEINTLPFMTPLYARTPVVAFICQLARNVWFYEAPPVVAQFGYVVEPLYLQPYRHVPTLTISSSSARSLREEAGFCGEIGVMPMAVDQYATPAPLKLDARDDYIVALGRVTPSKRLEAAIRALALLQPPHDRLGLLAMGGGDDRVRDEMNALATRLGVADRVRWSGYVDEATKRQLLSRAKALVMTSVREGWGLAVTEAGLCGTPAVGYKIPGLVDSIIAGETGFLTEETPQALAQGLNALLSDGDRYDRLALAAQRTSKSMTWDKTSSYVEHFLLARMGQR